MARAARTDGRPPGSPLIKGKHPGVTTIPADTPNGVGRPQVVIDEVALYNLALTHASFDTMGTILGVSGQLLSVHGTYRAIIDKARAEKRQDLLAAQFHAALKDHNPTMLIWLGKQYLEQKDVQRVENTGADGKPVQVEHAFKAVAYFPENNRNKRLPVATVTAIDGVPVDQEVEVEVEEPATKRPRRRRAS